MQNNDTLEAPIQLMGVSTHNLKNVDITIAKGQITAVMGVSGSGKSSLVFTTLYGAAFRRFLAIQKSRLKRKLDTKQLPRPVLKGSANLPAAIALRQHLPFFPQRATVGSYSEIYPVLRRLIASEGQRLCPDCSEPLRRCGPHQVSQLLRNGQSDDDAVIIAAPIHRQGTVSLARLAKELMAAGFSRTLSVTPAGEATVHKLAVLVEEADNTKDESDQDLAVVVDKTTLSEANEHRIEEAASLAYRIADGELIAALTPKKGQSKTQRLFKQLCCVPCQNRWPELTASHYNPASDEGSCPSCQGIGWLVSAPPADASPQALAWWQHLKALPELSGALTAKAKRQLDAVARTLPDDGLQQLVAAILEKDDSYEVEALLRRELAFTDCGECAGSGIRRESLATELYGIPFGDWLSLSVGELHGRISHQHQQLATDGDQEIPTGLTELLVATETLVSLRLSYLSLSEKARQLSGGEVQRIGLAKVLASDLHDCLICLDEPSACLHPADVAVVLGRIKSLAGGGNTVVVVDHHPLIQTIADHTMFIGPFGGAQGGRLVTGLPSFDPPAPAPMPSSYAELRLDDIHCRYFKGANVMVPMAKSSRRPAPLVAIAGISGSGKSTLVKDVLIPCLEGHQKPGANSPAQLTLPREVRTVFLDQKALGRSSRSNLLTYLGLATPLRKAFAAHPEARRRGYTPAHFNRFRAEGACERCEGSGIKTSRTSGEAEATLSPCVDCDGHGFKKPLLEIKHLDLSIVDIHQLTLTDALTAFADDEAFVAALKPLETFGLGYLTLGQSTATYSGGQAQRLRLARLMATVDQGAAGAKPPLVILDEPSLGLSPYDVAGLICQFQAMAAKGITVIIVEHNLDILRCCQWLIELGPGAGPAGSQIIYQGPKEQHPGGTPLGDFL